MLDSVIKVNNKYYPQTLFKECKYEIKRTKRKIVLMMIPSSSAESDCDSDNESDNESENETDNKSGN